MTPNQISKLEGIPAYSGGDMHFIPANFMSVETYTIKNTTEQPPAPAEPNI